MWTNKIVLLVHFLVVLRALGEKKSFDEEKNCLDPHCALVETELNRLSDRHQG